jgi:hypothetical protein
VRPAGAQSDLHLVHITGPPVGPGPVDNLPPDLGPGIAPTLDWAKRRLLESGAGTLARIVPHVRFGDPANELADIARELAADLVVVGGHKRGALLSALHRSMLARLVRRSPCSVLTALPKEPPIEASIEPACVDCVSVRRESAGGTLWCSRHTGHHVHAHLHHGAHDGFSAGTWTFRT